MTTLLYPDKINKNVYAHEKERKLITCTIKDIAKACKVSEGTVDRALHGRGGIRQETKERILAEAKTLGYQPNHAARCLATGSSRTIGVVCIDLCNPFFTSFIEAVEGMAQEQGYFIHLILTHNDPARELEGIRYLAGRQVEGVIVFPVGRGEDYEQELLRLQLPIVTIYNRISPQFIHVDVDCRQIMRNAVSFIAQKGYKRILYLEAGVLKQKEQGINTFSMEERRNGYLEGMEDEFPGQAQILECFQQEELLRLTVGSGQKTAVLCAFDRLALQALMAFQEQGIQIPEEVGIMGFDNIDILPLVSPRIVSVDCQIRSLGRKAFAILLRKIRGDSKVTDCVAGYRFTEGETL